MDIKIYSTPTCGYCHQAKAFLDERGVKYTDYDVSRDQAAAQEMAQVSPAMHDEFVLEYQRPIIEKFGLD